METTIKTDEENITMLKQILDNYRDEMIAEGAWSGHSNAAEYLADIRNDLINVFTNIADRYTYEKGYLYKNGQMCISADEKGIWYNAKRGIFYLEDDYNELINDIFSIDNQHLSSHKKEVIAKSLDKEFRTKLEDAVEQAEFIIAMATGEYARLDAYFEERKRLNKN